MQWLMADAEGDKIVMHLFYALQRPGTLDDPSHSVDSFRLKLLEALHPHMEQLSSVAVHPIVTDHLTCRSHSIFLAQERGSQKNSRDIEPRDA